MKLVSYLFLGALVVSLSCCSSKPKPKDVAYDANGQPTLPIPSYSRNALDGWPEGRKVDPYDVTRVRVPEEVHTYYVGRLPTYDRRDMNEAHTVYRVEQNARWDQRMPATPMASRGAIFGIREPTHNTIPEDQVVENERARQRELSEMLQTRYTKMTAKLEELQTYLASAPDKNKTIQQLSKEKAANDKELSDLKEDYKRLKAQLLDLQERQAMEDAISKGPRKGKKPDTTKPSE